MIKLDNKEFIEKQEWFNQIKDNISPYDLMKQWNYWGHKIKSLVTSSLYPYFLWTHTFSVLNKIVGNYRETFRYSMLIYPAFVLLKYLVLLFVFRRNLLLILYTLLVVDFLVLYPFHFSPSAYATLFFVTGLLFRFFYEGPTSKKIMVSYPLMIFDSLLSLVSAPVLLVVLTTDLIIYLFYEKYQNLLEFVSKNFLTIFFSTLIVIFVLIWSKAAFNVATNLDSGDLIYFYAHKVLINQNKFFGVGLILSVILFNYMASELKEDKMITTMKLYILLSVIGPAISYIISPLLPIVMKVSSFSRIICYIYAIAMFGVFYAYQLMADSQPTLLKVRKDIRYILLCLLLFGFLTGYHTYGKYKLWAPKHAGLELE